MGWEYVVLVLAVLTIFAAWAAVALGRVRRQLATNHRMLMLVAEKLLEMDRKLYPQDRREPKTVSDRGETTSRDLGGND